jgi:putative DNA primase/helicase
LRGTIDGGGARGIPDVKDMNDLRRAGVNIRELADSAKAYEPKANGKASEGFNLVCVGRVEPVAVNWLWSDRLARGKLTLLGGNPDLGKSMIAIDAAARLTTARHWPNGPCAPLGSAIFICSEDDVADTIRPRAEAAGADLDLLHVFKSTLVRDGKRRTFSLQHDLAVLGEAVTSLGNAALVVIDAITSYVGMIDSHRTTDVRAVLEPVGDFAQEFGVSVLGITHPPKAHQANAIHAYSGSLAFVAAPRLAFFVTEEPETERRLLLPVKNNLGLKAPGIGYYIGTQLVSKGIVAPYILWDDAPVDLTANQALAANAAALKDGGALNKAKQFLRELLANGPVDAKDGEEAAKANGISDRTLDRARTDLGVKAEKDGYQGAWRWHLTRPA